MRLDPIEIDLALLIIFALYFLFGHQGCLEAQSLSSITCISAIWSAISISNSAMESIACGSVATKPNARNGLFLATFK
jgi:hypothetical protein